MKVSMIYLKPRTWGGVYVLRQGEKVIYVGRSRNVFARLCFHKRKNFDSVQIHWCGYLVAVELEQQLIASLKPELNFTGTMSRINREFSAVPPTDLIPTP